MGWDEARERVREELAGSVFDLWIEPIRCVNINTNRMLLSCPDRYFSAYVQQNFASLIEEKISEVKGNPLKVCFEHGAKLEESVETTRAKGRQMRLPNLPSGGAKFRALHPKYTFSEFMVGESNILAQSACKAISSRDDSIGPCLFINSSTGLGKSHLTHAVAHQVLSESPMTRLHYLTAQQFSSEMVKNITTNRMDEFKKKYHEHCDLLLIEDIHALAGKKKTQEELNELLDTLIKTGKKVVFTANTPPRDLAGIDNDFCSRMTSGLVTAIHAPDVSTRKRIALQKAAQQNLQIDEEYLEYIAQHIKGDVRKIESAMIVLKAKSNLMGGSIDKRLVEEVVQSVAGVVQMMTPVAISEFISGQFQVSLKDMQSRSRKKKLTFPRQVAMYLSRKHTNESLAEIGKIFNRDHSTVMHAIKVVTNMIHRDRSVEAQIELLSKKVIQL